MPRRNYNGDRCYDSYLNRFLSPDSIIPDPYDPQSWDRYAYVRNNPVNRIDPTGHADDDCLKKCGGEGSGSSPSWLRRQLENLKRWFKGENPLEEPLQTTQSSQDFVKQRLEEYEETRTGLPKSSNRYTGDPVTSNNKYDPSAQKLSEKLGGKPQSYFSNDPSKREFDVISDEYIGQTKPENFTMNEKWRTQAKETFQAAKDSGKVAYFHFEGAPNSEVDIIRALERYSERYGVDYVYDTNPLFP